MSKSLENEAGPLLEIAKCFIDLKKNPNDVMRNGLNMKTAIKS